MLHTINRKWAMLFGCLLAFPTAYFILINFLNEYGYSYLYNSAQPILNSMGIKESLGFNINLLILFGPLLALVLNLLSVIRCNWYNDATEFSIKFSVQKHWWNMALIFFSVLLLAVLFVYVLGENCRC